MDHIKQNVIAWNSERAREISLSAVGADKEGLAEKALEHRRNASLHLENVKRLQASA